MSNPFYVASELQDVKIGEQFVFPDDTGNILTLTDYGYYQDKDGKGSYVQDSTNLVWIVENRIGR